jgi:hypothetical protein
MMLQDLGDARTGAEAKPARERHECHLADDLQRAEPPDAAAQQGRARDRLLDHDLQVGKRGGQLARRDPAEIVAAREEKDVGRRAQKLIQGRASKPERRARQRLRIRKQFRIFRQRPPKQPYAVMRDAGPHARDHIVGSQGAIDGPGG